MAHKSSFLIIILMIIIIINTFGVMGEPSNVTDFKVRPIIVLKAQNNIINQTSDIFMVLYMENPAENSVDLNVQLNAKKDSAIHIYGDGFTEDQNGNVYGLFTLPSGKKPKAVIITIKSEKAGKFAVQFNGTYWPGANKDASKPISLNLEITATEQSSNPKELGGLGIYSPPNKTEISPNPTTTTKSTPGFTVVALLIIITIIKMYKKNKIERR